MENALATLLAHVIWEALSFIVGLAVGIFISRILIPKQVRDLRDRVSELEGKLGGAAENAGQEDSAPSDSETVDWMEAQVIIDRYIGPALVDKPERIRLTLRKGFMDRFEQVTGAKLGEFEYNRALLHQWMEHNAARFLIENVEDMR